MKTRVVAPTIGLVLALLSAGCGGGGSSSPAPGSPPPSVPGPPPPPGTVPTPPPAPATVANSVAQVKSDQIGTHESTSAELTGASYYQNGPAISFDSAPGGAVALGGFGQVLTAAGHASTNTRVQLRNLETFVLSRTTNTWKRVQYSDKLFGAYYPANYGGNAVACLPGTDVSSCLRAEADGGVSVKPVAGRLFRFWPESGVTQSLINAPDVEAVFTTVQTRLIKDIASGADDTASAKLLVNAAADWWTSIQVPFGTNFFANDQVGNGKLRLALTDWRAVNFHSGSSAQADALDGTSLVNSKQLAPAAARRVIVIGDSISQGNGSGATRQDSFRRLLWNGIVSDASNPLVDFVGSRRGTNVSGGTCNGVTVPDANGGYAEPEFDVDHEAFWGYCVDDVDARLATSLATTPTPDVALIHLGTNDLLAGRTAVQIGSELTSVIARLRNSNASIRIVLAKLIPFAAATSELGVFNARIDAIASSLGTAQSPITVVDQFTGFNSPADQYDGLHPNDAGEVKMAAKWLPLLKNALQ